VLAKVFNMVQIGDGTVTADEQMPPEHRANVQQQDLEVIEADVGGG